MCKIKNIEFLRFLLCATIVIFHSRPQLLTFLRNDITLYGDIISNSAWGYLSVDAFFMISGFFLFLKTDFTQKFSDFAKKKLIRLMPVVVFMLLLGWITSLFTPAINFHRYENIFTLLNIQNIGITFSHGVFTASWYVSALFWSMCFYFYLYKILQDKRWFNLITACTIFFCYSLLLHANDWINPKNVAYVFNIGMMRAFAGLGVGYFLSMIYKDNIEKIRITTLNIWQKLFVTAFEVYILSFTFYHLCLHKMNYDNPMIIILAFIPLIWLFLIKKGYLTRLLENDLSVLLGQFTFSIFLTHQYVIKLWKYYICEAHKQWVIGHSVLNLVLFFVTVAVFGVVVYYLVEKPVTKYLLKKFQPKS
jgi:peptidoglycan/LPS O-acetylase OafA/YrhL